VTNTIPLPDLPRALVGMGISAPYLTLWRLIVAGDLPAHRQGRQWHIASSDLPVIAGRLRSSVPARG
jgi:hypothetical protein